MPEETKEETVDAEEEKEVGEVDHAELELEGAIFYVEKDKDGNIVSREELDSKVVLNALVSVLEASMECAGFDEEETEDTVVIED